MATALLTAYAALVLAMVATEAWARRDPDRRTTLDDLVGALVRIPPLRWLLLAGWMWLGWHVFVRSTR